MSIPMIGMIIYVLLSSIGLTLIKKGLAENTGVAIDKLGFSFSFSWLLLLGMFIYIFSFLLSLYVMKRMNLNVYYPISAGLIYIVVCAMSIFVLKESFSAVQLVGMGIILAGIVIMNLGRVN